MITLLKSTKHYLKLAATLAALAVAPAAFAQLLPSMRLPLEQKIDTTVNFNSNNGEFSGSYRIVGQTDSDYNIFISNQYYSRQIQFHTSLDSESLNKIAIFGTTADKNCEVFSIRRFTEDTIEFVAVDTMAKYRYITIVNGLPLSSIFENDSSMTPYTGENGWTVSWPKLVISGQSLDTVKSTTITFAFAPLDTIFSGDTLYVTPLKGMGVQVGADDDFRLTLVMKRPQKVKIANLIQSGPPIYKMLDTTLPAVMYGMLTRGGPSKAGISVYDVDQGIEIQVKNVYKFIFEQTPPMKGMIWSNAWYSSDSIHGPAFDLTWANDGAYHRVAAPSTTPDIMLFADTSIWKPTHFVYDEDLFPYGVKAYMTLDTTNYHTVLVLETNMISDQNGAHYQLWSWGLQETVVVADASGDSLIANHLTQRTDANGFTLREITPDSLIFTIGEKVGLTTFADTMKYPTTKPTHARVQPLDLLEPVANAVLSDSIVTFNWQTGQTQFNYPGEPKPIEYRFRLSYNAALQAPVVDSLLPDTALTLKLPPAMQTGYWQVSTTAGQHSAVWSFTEQASGVNETNESSGQPLLIYPNPTKGEAILKLADVRGSRVELCDLLGRVVRTFDAVHGPEFQFDISDLPDGAYILRDQTSGKHWIVVKN